MGRRGTPNSLCFALAGALVGAAASSLLFLLPDESPLPTEAEIAALEHAAPAPLVEIEDIDTVVLTRPVTQVFTLRVGDTLSDLLSRAGLDRAHAFEIVEALKKIYNPRRLQAGLNLSLTFLPDTADTAPRTLESMAFEVEPGQSIALNRNAEGAFNARAIMAESRSELVRYEGMISTSLFAAAEKQGVPLDVLNEMVKLFSYDVDFQREIQAGDRFSVMYERTVTQDGRPIKNGRVKYTAMNLSGVALKLYAFTHADGFVDYYNDKGEGVRKALMRTPINGARLTSGFGLRRHPILGYSKMHRGVDFGAPTGTPVFAAGDGVIEKRGPNGSFGNYVRLRHHSGYSTAYAHLSRFGPDTAVGKRVRQGQIIGYVGSSGRSTGPHLHFEVHKDNAQVNPITVKFPASQKLEGTLLAQFRQARTQIDTQLASLGESQSVASIEAESSTSAR